MLRMRQFLKYSIITYVKLLFAGGCSSFDQLHFKPGRLDRMGLPEDELSLAQVARHDARRPGLSHVAPLRTGMHIQI